MRITTRLGMRCVRGDADYDAARDGNAGREEDGEGSRSWRSAATTRARLTRSNARERRRGRSRDGRSRASGRGKKKWVRAKTDEDARAIRDAGGEIAGEGGGQGGARAAARVEAATDDGARTRARGSEQEDCGR